MELPPQRFSRPSQSTALPPILNFFTDGLSNLRFCSLTAPGGAAHHSFALDCADACLADSYARPSQSTAALTHPKLFYRRSLKPTVLFADRYPTVPAQRHERAYYTVLGAGCQFICWGKIIMLANVRLCDIIIPTERANIKGNKTWLNLFW